MAEGFTPLSGQPFVGGAERARRNARKRARQPPQKRKRGNNCNYHPQHKRREGLAPYPKSMREYERFFGALLASSPVELQLSEAEGGAHQAVMHRARSLLGVPSLPAPSHLQPNTQQSVVRRSSSCVSNASSTSAASVSSSGTYDNAREYYMSKAPLILEESRCIVAESLAKVSRNDIGKRGGSGVCFNLELASVEEKYPKLAERQPRCAPLILNFDVVDRSSSTSNGNPRSVSSALKRCQRADEKSRKWTRPGSVLLLRQERQDGDTGCSALACIVPNGNKQSSSNDSTLSLMIFRRDDLRLTEPPDDINVQKNISDERLFYTATPLTTLIAQVRQMEACLRMVKVSFMSKLLGQKRATHIRFGDSSDEESEDEEKGGNIGGTNNLLQEGFYVDDGSGAAEDDEDEDENNRDWSLAGLLTKIPQLNQTQERAATSFLESPKESLILVQGPPGTGKSTFLVNVICRRLAANPSARLLVTAPTNKAVTVLAERFLDVVSRGDENLSCKINAVMVGVEDKLISPSKNESEYISVEALSLSLQGIFVYTWVDRQKRECESLLASLKGLHGAVTQQPGGEDAAKSLDTLISHAERVQTKICLSIPSQGSACRCSKMLVRHLQEMAAHESSEELEGLPYESLSTQLEMAIDHAQNLVDALDEVESPVQELLGTARVIFCTLATAGSSILKQTRRVDDLLIDEAAAATEPEICIPFHLRPQRLLAVGDPLQLPPTIMSRHAADMGLSVSVHERLMDQCSAEFIMLDHQYRMNPHISQFPCAQFYKGAIRDGDNVLRHTHKSDIQLPKTSPYLFVNVRGEELQMPGGSYANEAEVETVLLLVEMISTRQVLDWHSPDKLRIITFYAGQVAALQHALRRKGFGNVLVATCDSSQGCEADVCIISFVRSSPKKGLRRATGFLTDDRRLNVALTRARHQLLCVGDALGTLGREGSDTLKSLVADANKRGCLINDA
ncbi:hypothetical protein ACHAXT_000646 [Thalassiosira profunda]